MKTTRLYVLILAAVMLLSVYARADEGMWLLTMIGKNYDDMKKQGLKLSPDDIYNINKSSLKDAIVVFDNGCTGEIISDEGLLLTNHHCGYSRIQEHSTVEHDYLKDGFWAMSRSEELTNDGLQVMFLERIDDVSQRIHKALGNETDEEVRKQRILETSKAIEAEASKDNTMKAEVKSFFGGNDYYLLLYNVYKDVRLVGAPPSSIGKFGADTDNWMWPRHTGDFSIFRVYTSKDGKPAGYSAENIPMKPKKYLPVSTKGVAKGDFTMIMGYPGRTQRYMTSTEVSEVMTVLNPNRIKIRGTKQDIMMADMQADPAIKIKYASKYAHSSNYWKYSIGQNKGLARLNVIAKKQEQEKQFAAWIAENTAERQQYADALQLIEKSVAERRELKGAQQYLSECFVRGCEIFNFATKCTSMSVAEIEKYYKDYNTQTDLRITVAMMQLYANNVPDTYRPDFLTAAIDSSNGFEAYVRTMFDNSLLIQADNVIKLAKSNELKDALQNDPAYLAALSVLKQKDAIDNSLAGFEANFTKGHRLYVAGTRQMTEGQKKLYPDANFTMRLTYGTVGDYEPADAIHYDYYTTIEGIMEKEDPDNWEFVVPTKLKKLYQDKDYGSYADSDGNLRVCFTTNNDITGGNSGSPVINGRGELVGCAFDGNWEAMSGDIAFEPQLQKCIAVDIRYILFIIDKYAGASHLVKEMKIVK